MIGIFLFSRRLSIFMAKYDLYYDGYVEIQYAILSAFVYL